MSGDESVNPRREFLRKSLVLIPVVTVAGSGFGAGLVTAATSREAPAPTAPSTSAYEPNFFTAEEWSFLQAAVARLIPRDDLGPGALEAGVPEFIDRQMNTPYATGALWFMQAPFNADAPPEMGYQFKLVPQSIYRLGIAACDGWCRQQHGKSFAQLDAGTQDEVLKQLESGAAQWSELPAKTFFSALLQNTREGFFSDPIHGGNKGMVGWTMVGFPGARADFMDWVERNEAYPFPAVSIRGERA